MGFATPSPFGRIGRAASIMLKFSIISYESPTPAVRSETTNYPKRLVPTNSQNERQGYVE
jgi:hypothetical protein